MPILTLSSAVLLLLFGLTAVGVCLLAEAAIVRREAKMPRIETGQLHDPYPIAFLRGGITALIEVAALTLRRRGMLTVEALKLRALDTSTGADALLPIEAAVLNACRSGRPAAALELVPEVVDCASTYSQGLAQERLIAGPDVRAARRAPCLLGIAAIAAAGTAATVVTWPQGPANSVLLLLATLGAVMYLAGRMQDVHTRRGRQALRELRTLFARVRPKRAGLDCSSALAELALLAAVYGVEYVRASALETALAAPGQADQTPAERQGCGGCG